MSPALIITYCGGDVSGGDAYARVVSELGGIGATVIDDNTDLLDSGVDVTGVTAQEHPPSISPVVRRRYRNVFIQAISLYNNATNRAVGTFSSSHYNAC